MTPRGKIRLTTLNNKAIFPQCEEEYNHQPIVFHVAPNYNEKVKMHDWQTQCLAEPRDNVDIFPPKGNLYKSSYRRLGPDIGCTGISETRAMLSQIELQDRYKPIYGHRHLANSRSFASANEYDGEDEEKGEEGLNLLDMLKNAEAAGKIDYRTTTEVDYKLPYPIKSEPLPPPPLPIPWLLNRRTIGYSYSELGKRDGIYTFLDDNMELHKKIADLKMHRNQFL